jgi:hypothetical protein
VQKKTSFALLSSIIQQETSFYFLLRSYLLCFLQHAETQVMRLREEGGRSFMVQRERLFFPGADGARLAQMLFDDERHQPLYYPPCIAGHTLQHFGPDFKTVKTLYKTR